MSAQTTFLDPVRLPTNEELAWAAGLIDGEGYLGVARCRQAARHTAYGFQLRVKMCHRATIARLRDIFEAGFLFEEKHNFPHSNAFMVTWHNRSAQDVIRLVFPYLFTKKYEASLVLDFEFSEPRRHGSVDYHARFEALYQGLRAARQASKKATRSA